MSCNKKESFVPQIFFEKTTTEFINEYKTFFKKEKKEKQKKESTMYPHSDNHNIKLSSSQSNSPIAYSTDLFHDPLMSDVTYFPNDENINDGGELGIYKCFEECTNGSCVEYGVTGNAHCFPYKNTT